MKPDNWNSMSLEEKKEIGFQLVSSFRGEYLISQALYYAIQELKKAQFPEQSNIEDMEILRETQFGLFLEPMNFDELLKRV